MRRSQIILFNLLVTLGIFVFFIEGFTQRGFCQRGNSEDLLIFITITSLILIPCVISTTYQVNSKYKQDTHTIGRKVFRFINYFFGVILIFYCISGFYILIKDSPIDFIEITYPIVFSFITKVMLAYNAILILSEVFIKNNKVKPEKRVDILDH